jgi:hypothetical protein
MIMHKNHCWTAIFLVTLLAAGALLAGCPPCNNKLEVHNSSLLPITGVYVRVQGSDDWGSNKIGDTIWPNETENITHLFPGCYEVRIVSPGSNNVKDVCIVCQDTYTIHAGNN